MTSILDRPLKARTFIGVSLRRRTANAVATVLVTLSVAVALVPLVWVLYSVVAKGFSTVRSTIWWTHSRADMTAFLAGGGAYHAIVGTVLQGLPCAAVSVPSIVAALFIYALCIATLGLPRSGFAVSLSLVLLPVIVRATEEMLRVVPVDLREASYALGVPKWKTIIKIVLPAGLSGILTGILLALARVMGETAPLLLLVRLFAGDEHRYVQRLHGVVARDDVRPNGGRCRHQSDFHGSAVGCCPYADRTDRRHQCGGQSGLKSLCTREARQEL